MRIISNKALLDFALKHPGSGVALQAWRAVVEASAFENFAQLKEAFNATDRVGDFYVFNIGDNKYRLVAAIHFNRQMLFVRHVLTHKEYDKWKP